MNKKQLIINAFEKMDITMLEVLLDDSPTYQGVPKELFLERLENLFLSIKNFGDMRLIAHAGVCCADDCPNSGCSGYSFVGNNENSHLDLIFEETDNSFKDIYYCAKFNTHERIPAIFPFFLIFYDDENVNFSPSPELALNIHKYKSAVDEITEKGEIYQFDDDCLSWLEKHDDLFKKNLLPHTSYKFAAIFNRLYRDFSILSEYIAKEKYCKDALIDFDSVNIENEMELLNWLVKYETLGLDFNSLLDYTNENIFPKAIIKTEENTIYASVLIEELENVLKFKLAFEKYYWYLLEKYRVKEPNLTDGDKNVVTDVKAEISLEFQLTKRGIILSALNN